MTGVLIIAMALLATGCSASVQAHDWGLTEVEGTRLTLIIVVGSSSCDRFREVTVAESDTTVEITALVTESRKFGMGCTADLTMSTADVELSEPLGERVLVGCQLGEAGYFRSEEGAPRESCSQIVAG